MIDRQVGKWVRREVEGIFYQFFPLENPDKYNWLLTSQIIHLIFVYAFICCFGDRVFLCIPGFPGTFFIDEAGLELRDETASCSLSAMINGMHHHH